VNFYPFYKDNNLSENYSEFFYRHLLSLKFGCFELPLLILREITADEGDGLVVQLAGSVGLQTPGGTPEFEGLRVQDGLGSML
jgi:hypothetical protein